MNLLPLPLLRSTTTPLLSVDLLNNPNLNNMMSFVVANAPYPPYGQQNNCSNINKSWALTSRTQLTNHLI